MEWSEAAVYQYLIIIRILFTMFRKEQIKDTIPSGDLQIPGSLDQ
jgi:hypothetical protein